jgi:hypothetical protein
MDRATRFLWDMQCGRKDHKLFQKAMRLLGHVIERTGDLTLLTDGERRYGSLLFELCSEALRIGKRGRPKKMLPQGVKERRKNKESQRRRRGPKRSKYQAPYPEHPDTVQPVASTDMHANHLEAFHASLRRRCATYRRQTNMYAKTQGASRKDWMSTGLCIILFRCMLRHGKSRPWLEGFWTMAARSMSSS